MNVTACAIEFMITTRRGGLTCPPETQRARTNEIVHHLVHGNYNQVAHSGWNSVERYFRQGMLARPYGV